nr:MAG TPA: hypothetical protein [Caudoviricetes sp.]
MKKKQILFLSFICSFFPCTTAYANIDDVNSFLSQYAQEDNAFYTEEYIGKDSEGTDYKTLIVRIDLSKLNIEPSDSENIFAEMVTQEWFDYTTICNINVSSSIGALAPTYFYDIKSGTKIDCTNEHPSSMRFPWIIKTENDISDNERRFILRIAQEILQGRLDTSVSLHIGADNESDCTFKICNGLAEVNGMYELNGNNYKFSTQFTYVTEDYQNGSYEELYLGANNTDIYGTNIKFEYRTFEE